MLVPRSAENKSAGAFRRFGGVARLAVAVLRRSQDQQLKRSVGSAQRHCRMGVSSRFRIGADVHACRSKSGTSRYVLAMHSLILVAPLHMQHPDPYPAIT